MKIVHHRKCASAIYVICLWKWKIFSKKLAKLYTGLIGNKQ